MAAPVTIEDTQLAPAKQLEKKREWKIEWRVLGENHPSTQSTMNNLGILYLYEGKYTQAEPVLAKLLQAQRKQGDENSDALRTMSNLALVYRSEGKYARAEVLLARLLEVRRRELCGQHPNTLITMTNLGTVYRGQRRYAEAEALYTKAVEDCRELIIERTITTYTRKCYKRFREANRSGRFHAPCRRLASRRSEVRKKPHRAA